MCEEHDKLAALIHLIVGDDGDGAEEVIGRITHIVCENVKRGRFKTFLDAGKGRSPEAYIRRVVENYGQHHAYVDGLQHKRDSVFWEPFYQQVQNWALAYLFRCGFMPNEGTFRIAQNCVSLAAEQLLLAHFPYDIPFACWARRVVQNVCRKQVTHDSRQKYIPDKQLVGFEQWVSGAGRWHTVRSAEEELLLNMDMPDYLEAALGRLSANSRVVIQLFYFADMGLAEIAVEMNKPIRSVYNFHHRGMKRLREILTADGYNIIYGGKRPIWQAPRPSGVSSRPTESEGSE